MIQSSKLICMCVLLRIFGVVWRHPCKTSQDKKSLYVRVCGIWIVCTIFARDCTISLALVLCCKRSARARIIPVRFHLQTLLDTKKIQGCTRSCKVWIAPIYQVPLHHLLAVTCNKRRVGKMGKENKKKNPGANDITYFAVM